MTRISRWAAQALTLALAAAVLTGPAARADDAKKDDAKKVEGDLKKMQGTWVRDGEEGPDVKFTFEGDTLKVAVDGMDYVCKITLDSKASPHPAVDLTVKGGALNRVYALGDPEKHTMNVAVHVIATGSSGSAKPGEVNTGTGGQAAGQGPSTRPARRRRGSTSSTARSSSSASPCPASRPDRATSRPTTRTRTSSA